MAKIRVELPVLLYVDVEIELTPVSHAETCDVTSADLEFGPCPVCGKGASLEPDWDALKRRMWDWLGEPGQEQGVGFFTGFKDLSNARIYPSDHEYADSDSRFCVVDSDSDYEPIKTCAKCGGAVIKDQAVIDHGSGPEAGKLFVYCSVSCRDRH